jgi:hypothetical protein
MRLARAIPTALAACALLFCAPRSAHAQTTTETPKREWGDVSLSVVERFGYLAINGAEQGKAGMARGPGLELRFMLPIGWGAYYRHIGIATANDDRADWKHSEFIAGLSRRLVAVGSRELWSARASARFDFGVGWTQTGTHERCTRSFVPYGTDCVTGPGRPRNVQGDAMAFETRVGADIGFGPLYLGLDIGMSAYLNVTTGNDSASLPWLFLSPSGQLKLGLGLPFS